MKKIIQIPFDSHMVSRKPSKAMLRIKGHDPHKDLATKIRGAVSKSITAALKESVLEGVITSDNLEVVAQHADKIASLIKASTKAHIEKLLRKSLGILRELHPRKKIILQATDGRELISTASEVFCFIDPHFKSYCYDRESSPTPEMRVKLYELVSDGSFSEIFKSFSTDLNRLCFTQGQIMQFAIDHSDLFREEGHTSFLFKVGGAFYVANIIRLPLDKKSDGGYPSSAIKLRVILSQYGFKQALPASLHYQVVIPSVV